MPQQHALVSGGRGLGGRLRCGGIVRAGVLAMAVICLLARPAVGEGWLTAPWQPERDWSVTAFLGQADDARFVEILSLRGGDLLPSYIAGAAVNRRFAVTLNDGLHWEMEGSLYRHWGRQHHWEGNVALMARWTKFPWDRHVNTSVAVGQGFSLASERPPLERETRVFLHHLLAEVEFAPPRDSPWSVVGRAHHRSGVFGLYGVSGGSNFLTLGVRYRF